jgi:hypothetical protein
LSLDPNAGAWTSAQLLSDVRQAANLPTTSTDWTDTAILAVASNVIHDYGSWALTKSGDGRLVEMFHRSASAALASPYRAGSDIDLPPLAVGDTFQHVSWVDSSGARERRLQQVDGPMQSLYDSPGDTGDPAGYSVLAGRIRLYPQPTTGGVIRFTYQRRHPDLVPDTATYVSDILGATDAGSGYSQFTTTGVPAFQPGDLVDIVNGQQPYRVSFSTLYVGGTSTNSCTLFLPYPYLAQLAPLAGMRLVKAGRSPYVHLPYEMKAMIADKAASVIMRRLGDLTGSKAAELAADATMGRVLDMLNPRSRADRRVAVSPYSHLRARASRGRR